MRCTVYPKIVEILVGRDLSPKRDNHRNSSAPFFFYEDVIVKRKSAHRTAIPIGGKRDTFDQDLPVSASLLLANSATLQETLPMHQHTVTNVLSGLGSFVPYAISGAVYSGTLSPTAFALTGVFEFCCFASFFRQLPRLCLLTLPRLQYTCLDCENLLC